MSPREDPNEGSYPRVRQSIEPVPSSSIDPGPASPTSMRVVVRRILRKYGYPPDMHVRATALVIEQAEQIGLDLQGI